MFLYRPARKAGRGGLKKRFGPISFYTDLPVRQVQLEVVPVRQVKRFYTDLPVRQVFYNPYTY